MSKLSKLLFCLAAIMAILGGAAHEIIGAPKVLGPLATSGLPKDVIWLHHFSWHVGTLSVAVMASMFILASRNKTHLNLAIMATLLTTAFALLGVGLAILGNSVLWSTPAPYAWAPIAVLGWIGIWAAYK